MLVTFCLLFFISCTRTRFGNSFCPKRASRHGYLDVVDKGDLNRYIICNFSFGPRKDLFETSLGYDNDQCGFFFLLLLLLLAKLCSAVVIFLRQIIGLLVVTINTLEDASLR